MVAMTSVPSLRCAPMASPSDPVRSDWFPRLPGRLGMRRRNRTSIRAGSCRKHGTRLLTKRRTWLLFLSTLSAWRG